jgi:hypothetical protein
MPRKKRSQENLSIHFPTPPNKNPEVVFRPIESRPVLADTGHFGKVNQGF